MSNTALLSDRQIEPSDLGYRGVAAEITGNGRLPLCDRRGRLNRQALGWSRRPVQVAQLHGPWLRQKRWDAWGIASEQCFVLFAVMSLDYVSLAVIYLYDFESGTFSQTGARRPFSFGCCFSPSPADGTCSFSSPKLSISTVASAGKVLATACCADLGGKQFEAEFQIDRPPGHESLNLVVPWSERRYHFTSKQACLPTVGWARYGKRRIDFHADNTTAWLDFARGIWPYASGWNWAMCSGSQAGRPLGFNLGSGWTSGTGVNENAVYLDGQVIKLPDEVRFEYDRANPLLPWRIRSIGSNAVDLRFLPVAQHAESLNLLLIRGQLKQLYGHFSGCISDEAGAAIPIERMFGVVEDHFARW